MPAGSSPHPRGVGRPLSFDPDAALDRAVDAFWRAGYAGTSTSVLEAATGLSRSSLLNTFGSKRDLLLAALDRYQDQIDDQLLSPLLQAEAGPNAAAAFFTQLAAIQRREHTPSGCLIVRVAADPIANDPQVGQRIARYRTKLEAGFSAALSDAENTTERSSTLAALAIAMNWTAQTAPAETTDALAASACALVNSWSEPPASLDPK